MTKTVTVAVLSGGEVSLLERQLPAVVDELARRELGEEVLVVDVEGEARIGPWLAERHPEVALVSVADEEAPAETLPARALLAAAERALGEGLLVLAPTTLPRPGFLPPLVDALADPEVAAAAACTSGERFAALVFEDGRLHVVDRDRDPEDRRPYAVPFPAADAILVRTGEFLAHGGLDPLFVPGGFWEVDLGLAAQRAGRAILAVPRAEVERLEASTRAPEDLTRAAREKNRLLLYWKYLDTRRDAHDHLALLWRDALEAAIAGRREELIWLALALQELRRVGHSRQTLGEPRRALEQMLRTGG